MDEAFALAFSASNFGPKKFQALLHHFQDVKEAWGADEKAYESIGITKMTFATFERFRRNFDIKRYAQNLRKNKISFISFLDSKYPSKLRKLENPPIGIFMKGNTELLREKLSIGVVGTRKITTYGRSVTESIVSHLVANDVAIVSGLALGVDAMAHRTAVSQKGKTIAVLACGVDCCRPTENFNLYQEILQNDGLIISEYPLSLPPQKGTFLARNRIIAALSDGVLVTEAAEDSGSLVTADWGFKLSKKVFAVPGPITSRMSDGSLKLLKQGAKLVSDAADILGEFDINSTTKKLLSLKNMTSEEKKIVQSLESEPLSMDEISKKTALSLAKIFVVISRLELNGVVINQSGKIRIK